MSNLLTDNNLLVKIDTNFLTKEEAQNIYNNLENICPFDSKYRNKNKSRTKVTYGDSGLKYTIQFGNNLPTVYKATEWNECPILLDIKERLENITNVKYNICVVQRYPHGGIGINKHRDKEMTRGTTICGVSLGETRTLRLSRGYKKYDISLPAGTLYLIQPPTNDYWCHEILKDTTKKPRISLTFRNYTEN